MMRRTQLSAWPWLCLLAAGTLATLAQAQDSKWSRQLDGAVATEAESLDWVPLAQPLDGSKDRSANGRVLTYSQSFPPNARFDLPKATHQTAGGAAPFDFPYQFQRFSNGQPQQLKTNSAGQEPTSQSFFKFEMPFHHESGAGLRGQSNSQLPPTLQTGYQIQHSFGGAGGSQASLFNSPTLFGQQPQFPPEFHARPPQKPLQQALHQQNYVDDILPLKSQTKPTQPSLQSVTPQTFPVDPQPESPSNGAPPSAQQEVELLYVPYDTLYNQQQQRQRPQSGSNYNLNKYNLNAGLPAVNPYQINQFYTQEPNVGSSDYFGGAPPPPPPPARTTLRPSTTSQRPQSVFQSYAQPAVPQQSQFTTVKPKPKAHQPPLAMFLLRNNARPSQSDVVAALRNARDISVIDAPTKQTPDIFVGPAGMPIPNGYVKFDLPYLSQLAHSRDLVDVPFFVAPLSYRTPQGFNKILLPEPHVGSIVVNRARNNQQTLTSTTTRNPFETTTLRGVPQPSQDSPSSQPGQAPSRGNKFSYFYVQDAIQEVTSPKIAHAKPERPHKKKRPQNVQVEQPVYRPPPPTPKNPFENLNQIGNDDFFSSLTNKPSTSSSTSTSTTTSTSTSTTAAPQSLFTYSTRPQVEFPSSNGQLYHSQFETVQPPQLEQEQQPRFTTRPPATTNAEEEYRMKQYFRQQDAFRQSRPQTTNPPFEQIQYTPVAVDYESETTTQKINASKGKQRVTIFTPSAIPVTTSDVGYNQLPLNHRPSYNQNEVLDNSNQEYEPNPYHVPSELPPLTPDIPGLVNNLQDEEREKLAATTTPLAEPEPDQRPTRRPLLRTRKPLVSKVTSSVSYSESESNGKQPTHRIRRPYQGTRASSNGDATGEESTPTTRRPSSGGITRSPIIRNPNRIRYQPTTEERQSFKLKPKKHYTGSQNHSHSKKNKQNEAQDLDYQRDVLKQNYPVFKGTRRPTSPTAIPSSYDVGSTDSGPASESQQVYTVTPSNSIDQAPVSQDQFPASLLEPMQIAQHYNEFSKDNYGPGYFPNQEDLNPTEAIVRNEVSPIYRHHVASTAAPTTTTTTTTLRTTTEAPTTMTTTRRSPFIRRNYPRLRTTTTTETPTTSTPAEERPSLRARVPPRRVIKVRQRNRRPLHPASSTLAPEEESEPVTQKQNLRKLSRYNQEQREKESQSQTQTQSTRRRYKQPFQLEGQESQWSPASDNGNENANSNSNTNSFKPLNPRAKIQADSHNFENEPEIVTVGPTQQVDTFEVNVAANLDGSAANQRTTLKAPNLKPEKSFAELLEEVMGKAPGELATESPSSTTVGRLARRGGGKWKKTRVSENGEKENFETAESQNLAPQQIYNALYASEKEEMVKTTTPLTPATEAVTQLLATTTPATPTTPEEYELTTAQVPTTTPMPEYSTLATTLPMEETGAEEESATRRMDTMAMDVDDLDTQPSLFSEVKKQLHDLFAIEENEDQAVTAALAAVGKRRQEYTSIKRSTAAPTEEQLTTAATPKEEENFHKDLMEHVVYATSTSTKVTAETEICYRGRCIRSEDLPANHKLH